MAKAICVFCGEAKDSPADICPACGLNPQINKELLEKSVYLSTGRFETDQEKAAYRQQLDEISDQIKSGRLVEGVSGSKTYSLLAARFLASADFLGHHLDLRDRNDRVSPQMTSKNRPVSNVR
jgi:hypothetical protein